MKGTVAMLGTLRGRAREYEKFAIRIRKFAGLSLYVRLDPFNLAVKLGMTVVGINELRGMSQELATQLLVQKAGEWSGASSGILPDGLVIIVLNDTQSAKRRQATLMEEVCHVLLGHQRDRLTDVMGSIRNYNQTIESEAYGVGSATLVPFAGLSKLKNAGCSCNEIAEHFGVSEALVEYRERLTLR